MLQPEQLLRDVLLPDMAAAATSDAQPPPLLRARALCTACRFAANVSDPSSLQPLLHALHTSLSANEIPQLRLSACRALIDLSESLDLHPSAPITQYDPSFSELLPSVVSLLASDVEDAVLLALEATVRMLKRRHRLPVRPNRGSRQC